ncbi:MAG TPA: TIGR01777 family oxidoreductase [Gemmataceae bacterium]|nr:TIGR01777 family oxidoreductase [Gemmataceae bacterium]
MQIFITGGTGLVGSRLVPHFKQRGDMVLVLSRRANVVAGMDCEMIQGDPTQSGDWQNRAAECDAIVNLAGENIVGKRWNDEVRRTLRESRVKATENCVQALSRQPRRSDGSPKVLVNASAIGYYGPHGDEELDENSPPGNDFLAGICMDWERATVPAKDAGVRVVLARIGVVLANDGGPLAKMLLPFKLGLGGRQGSGKQWFSWVHRDDVVGLIALALDNPVVSGPVNVTAPNPVTNKDFAKTLGRALGRPAFMPTPGFMLKLVMGDGAEIVLTGQRVLPKRAQECGYSFRFPELDGALAEILGS